MEAKELKKITRFDAYTVNEFVRNLVDTRETVKKEKETIAERVAETDEKLSELKADTEKISSEELDKYEKDLSSAAEEKKQIEETLKKWEDEKLRIKTKLEDKIAKFESSIKENEAKIKENEEKIEQNKAKMEGLDESSPEYLELTEENKGISKKISRLRGNLTRYDKKINDLKEIIGNLETENVLEGLKPPRTINRATTRSGRSTRVKSEPNVEQEVEPKVEPKVEPRVEPRVEPKVEPRVEPKVAPRVEPRVAPRVEPRVAPRVEPKVEPRVEQKVAPRVEPRVAPKVELKVEPKVEPKVDLKEELKVEPKEEPKVETKVESRPYSELSMEELKKKQRELWAKIPESDDYNYRTHQENGMGKYEEDWIDRELKLVRAEMKIKEELEKELKQKEMDISKEQEEQQRNTKNKNIFKKIKEFFSKIKNDIISAFNKSEKLPEPKEDSVKNTEGRTKFCNEIRAHVNEGKAREDAAAKSQEEKEPEEIAK